MIFLYFYSYFLQYLLQIILDVVNKQFFQTQDLCKMTLVMLFWLLLYYTKWFGQIGTIFQSLLAGYQWPKYERDSVSSKNDVSTQRQLNKIHNILLRSISKVGFIYTFWSSLSSTSSILEYGFQSIHHLQMISSEGFQQHFSIISKFLFCGKNHNKQILK